MGSHYQLPWNPTIPPGTSSHRAASETSEFARVIAGPAPNFLVSNRVMLRLRRHRAGPGLALCQVGYGEWTAEFINDDGVILGVDTWGVNLLMYTLWRPKLTTNVMKSSQRHHGHSDIVLNSWSIGAWFMLHSVS